MKILLLLLISSIFLSSSALSSYSVPGSGTLYGTDAAGGNLITVNPSDGSTSVIGNMGVGVMPALAVDPTSGIMYAGHGGGTPFVYIINPADGSSTFLADSGLGFSAISSMDFNSAGTLYAAVNIVGDGGTGGETLATINKITGIATVIGPFGTERMEAIAFASDGTLYGATTNQGGNTGELYTINTSTGQATLVAQILDVTGAPHPGGISSLQFACDGTLYAGTGKGGQVGFSDFVTINPSTGVYTLIGQALTSASLGALAFENVCDIVGGKLLPIDTTSLLLAGAQSTTWMIPLMLSVLGIGLFVVSRKSESS